MKLSNKEVLIKVPHRISGFFEIVDEIKGIKILNPERIGSRGSGFNLSAVGKTRIKVEKIRESERSECKIFIDDVELNEKAETTHYIFKYVKNLVKIPIKIKIFHYFELPVGCGYGASGSGALGTILGLNYLLNLNLSTRECGRVAHIAEVVNKTGLGTICGQLCGGLCILKEPGYPFVCERIRTPEDIRIISCSFGKIHTKSILSDPKLNMKIKEYGRIALKKLLHEPSLMTFIKISKDFVKKIGILDLLNLEKTKELIESLNELNIMGASMNQLGQSVYAICKENDVYNIFDVMDSFNPKSSVYILRISSEKPQLYK